MKSQFVRQPDQSQPKHSHFWQAGLTLIEILIIVAVLLLLMLALFRNFNKDVQKGNDAQRKRDLKEIKIAFEDYYSDQGCYPPADALSQCGGTNLNPYLKQIPCDPLGQAYLYLPESGVTGSTCGGYRILTQLQNTNDPSIEQVGCPGGCGVPEEIEDPASYNYGIAEGIALDQLAEFPIPEGEEPSTSPTPSISPTVSTSPTPSVSPGDGTVPVETCTPTHPCYCCDGTGGNDCNEWYYDQSRVGCNLGPFATASDCSYYTMCQ